MPTVATFGGDIGVKPACEALGLSRATYYRSKADGGTGGKPTPAVRSSSRALSPEERKEVLDLMHSKRFMDQSPREIYATLLDEGRYVCSVRTMYRVLEQESEVKERRNQLRHQAYAKPELLAAAPNQVWSWDITKLLGVVKLDGADGATASPCRESRCTWSSAV